MGAATKGLLLGRIKSENILNFIKQRYDREAKIKHANERHATFDNKPYDTFSCQIYFTSNKENRIIQVYFDSDQHDINYYKNIDHKNKYTKISMGLCEYSINIVRSIVAEFGGYIDESDSDDKGYDPIVKNPDGTIKPVFRVTMNDIYEKFGGVVIITDK